MRKVKNNDNDLTQGSIWKQLLLFAMPIFFGNVFQQLYNTADSLIVGRFLGEEALAAVASSGNLIFMFIGFFNGLAMGAGVIIARCFGAKDYEKMSRIIHTDVAFGLITGVFLTIAGIAFTPTVLRWMGTPAEVLPNSVSYFRFYFSGATFAVMYNIFVGILHAMGDSRHPLYYLICSSVLNVILDLVLVGIFRFGVGAAALATTVSQGLSAFLCFWRLVHLKGPGKLIPRKVGIDWESLKSIVKFGIPSGVQNSVIALANVVVQSNINAFDTAAMAGCGSYSKLEGFAFLPVTCFSQGLATFVGQNLGAKQYARAKRGAVFGIACSVVIAELVGVLFHLFAPQLISLFNEAPAVIDFGTRHARVISLFFGLLAFSHCSAAIIRGAGKPIIPMTTMLSFWCVVRVAYITIAVSFAPRLETISWAYPLTWSCSCVVFLIYLLKADWVHNFDRMETKGP